MTKRRGLIVPAIAIGLAVLAAGHSFAEYLPARVTEFTWNSQGMAERECNATIYHDASGVYRTDPEGQVVISWETRDRLNEQLSWSLVWSAGNSEHVKAIEVERSGCSDDGWCDYVHVGIEDLRELLGADRAALRLDVAHAQDAMIDLEAFGDLHRQWLDHWCEDPDGDRRYACRGIGHPSRVFLPPMRVVEQKALAACVEDNHIDTAQPASYLERVEYPLAGVLDWIAEAVWAEDCPEPESLERPFGMPREPLPPFFYCIVFTSHEHYEAGHCDPGLESWTDADGNPMSGHQLRYRFGQKYGAFPGFACPAPNPSGTKASAARTLRNAETLMRAIR